MCWPIRGAGAGLARSLPPPKRTGGGIVRYRPATGWSASGSSSTNCCSDATDAAGATGTQSETVDVDNSSPTVTLTGPTSAPSTTGTQYVTATGGGSIAPIVDIQCSVDGAPTRAPEEPRVTPASAPYRPDGAQEMDLFDKIERLAELHNKGILSSEEFAAKKAELLSRL